MLEATAAYREAIVGDVRHIYLRAVADISDPDKSYLPTTSSGEAPWSRGNQLYDKIFDTPRRYATLERGRWLLGRSYDLFPDNYTVSEHVGFAGDALSGEDGAFAAPPWVQLNFTGMSVLQACSVFFSEDPQDGVPADFTVEIRSGGTAYYSKTVTGNRETSVPFEGFTVWDPDCIRLTVSRWSLPGRRVRLTELVPGYYADWDAEDLEAFRVTQQGQFSCLSMPYGTAEIAIDNSSRRFEPRRKDGIFQSIEARQGIDLYIGVWTGAGAEYMQLGTFYQAGDGWKNSRNAMTIQWSLVDIIGLLAERTFLPPEVLPVTLAGWLEAIVSQLGEGFRKRWRVDAAYGDRPVIANSREAVAEKKCGEMIRWACMAAGAWPRAASTGHLTADPLWNQGNRVTLENLEDYPEMGANESLAALIFRLSDGTEYVVAGNATSSEKTVTIQNPFLHTRQQALEAAKLILSQYGGNIIETTGRGDPSGEIGDVDTIWLDETNAAAGRRIMQSFQIQDHAMRGCQSRFLQADGSYLWQNRTELTGSGTWTAPEGVGQLRLFLVGRGGDGQDGTDGGFPYLGESNAGQDGADGLGGRVWAGTVNINPGQTFSYSAAAEAVFGAYSSANGARYPEGYSDIASGRVYARTGVEAPAEGSGDGGAGGKGGEAGVRHRETTYNSEGKPVGSHWVVDSPPGKGTPGVPGVTGCIVIYWDKTT